MKNYIVGAVLILAGCQASTTVTASEQTAQTQNNALVQFTPAAGLPVEGGMVALINAERAARGLAPVRENARLSQAANAHAGEMVALGYFSHTGADGSRFVERAEDAGYTCAVAENIAQGQQSDAAVMAGWMGSAGHRRNILLPNVTEFGIGRVGNTWVQMFGAGC